MFYNWHFVWAASQQCTGFDSLLFLTLQKQLRENVASEHLWECSKYVVSEVFATLNEMFSSAKQIQVASSSISTVSSIST